ncbi:hypothetical protein KHP60_20400 [Microvirga sp. 3-52]|jgi:hypothetical protein|uniref:hypothetical protein n=1 Tax=Microvirga sp. 3-52 TaxID=2792425 RepID=UPI001AC61114|nr:hypothetical protein [Microvirga sp. 3-52]MBO1904764.1 hypothetical protein [Microvirga sp. 3-52]MBS7454677.1 hypothetical protein [Microvirga sp. 3-52]
MPVAKDALPRQRTMNGAHGNMITENDLKILWVARTLTNIDFQYGEDILSLDRSDIEVEQKRYIERQLLLKYRERREPYQKLLESLRA